MVNGDKTVPESPLNKITEDDSKMCRIFLLYRRTEQILSHEMYFSVITEGVIYKHFNSDKSIRNYFYIHILFHKNVQQV